MASRLMEMIEQRTKPHTGENIGKVSSHWKLIRESVQKGIGEDPNKVDKQQSGIVGHGVHKVASIQSEDGFQSVAFNSSNHQHVGVSPEGRITLYLKSGAQKHVDRHSSEPLSGLVYGVKTRQYVGWGQDESIHLMTEKFKVISTTVCLSRILCGVFNEATNEVITGGIGNICCWSFRYGAKYLLQRKAITDGLPEDSQITHMCLEDTPSRAQRCFSVYDTNVIVHCLANGNCTAHYRNLHSREITALLFFNPSKFLITAARDGSIKVWNDFGNIQIIFVGHLKSVNTLAVYPFGPYLMSGSNDSTIRVWSLDTADEVDRIKTRNPVLGLGTVVGKDNLYSFSGTSLDLWKINHVHSVYTTVGSKVKSMKPTTHPRFPVRMVCTCGDATVRLISPGSGACVTTLLIPGMNTIADVVCASAENLLFTLLSSGTILKASTKTNPCQILEEWDNESTKVPSICTCLCLYEYVVEDKLEGDQWGDLIVSTIKASQTTLDYDSTSKPSTYDRTLLLGGCADGTIVVYDWQNKKTPGSISFQIEAHREEIVTMIANPAVDQVISAGYDNSIKIWRLFPFAQEALAPLMTLYCQETPRHLAVAHHRLCVALHEPATASYNVVVFKTTQKARFDHNSDNDHADDVTGLTSCSKMRLFASSSVDGSIRIWDESNHLIRVITLNVIPTCLCFSGQKGDLLVGVGKHLHKIEYATYMPRSYIYRMVAMEFQRPVCENPIPIDPELKSNLSPHDIQRLTKAKSSVFKFDRFADLLSAEEMDEKEQEDQRRNQAFSKLQERENELQKLRDGVFEFQKRKPRPNSEMVKRDGFERYLSIFYKRPDIQIREEDEFAEDNVQQYVEPDAFTPERQPVGFFAIDMNSRQNTLTKKEPSPSVKQEIMSLSMPEFQPLRPPVDPEVQDGEPEGEFVVSRQGTMVDEPADVDRPEPSVRSQSMVLSKKQDFKSMSIEPPLVGSPSRRDRYIIDVPISEQYPSSTMCRHMVARRAARMVSRTVSDGGEETFIIAPDGFIPNSVVVSLFKDFKVEAPKPVETYIPPSLTAEQLAEIERRKKKRVPSPEEDFPIERRKSTKKPNRFTDQLMLALRDSPEPEPEVEIMESPLSTPPPSPPPEEPTPPLSPKLSPKKEVKPIKPIKKLVSRPKPPTPPPPTPPREPTPPPPPPPSPLQEFIAQFKGTLWFEKFFPNIQSDTFPKTVSGFVDLLLQILHKCSDYELKTQILAAILLLNRQEPFDKSCAERVSRSLLAELNVPNPPTAHGSSVAKQFLRVNLQLLHAMKTINRAYMIELMAQYTDGDEDVRNLVQELFTSSGIHDPKTYFPQELDSFDTLDFADSRRKARTREVFSKWMDKWLALFKQHIRSLAAKIGRAQAGNIVKGTKEPKTPSSIRGILKKDSNLDVGKPIVQFDMESLGSVAAESATVIEAVNYFCEIRMEEEIQKARERARVKPKPKPKATDNTRNTVLILPNIHSKRSLARLGETHCSLCHHERETAIAFRLPPIYKTKKEVPLTNMALRLNTNTINPFPDAADLDLYEAAQHAKLLTLRSSQKYFIPAQSIVTVYEQNIL